ncbi:MAG: hypothetical protein ACFFDT_00005, partial [Candidatus Hodarchaeota archaeon]
SGRFFATIGTSGFLLWDVIAQEAKWFRKAPSIVSGYIAISPDEKTIATTIGRSISIWNITDGTEIANYKTSSSTNDFVAEITFSRDGSELIFTGRNESQSMLFFLNISTGIINTIITPYGSISEYYPRYPLALSPDGSLLATGGNSENGYVLLWNLTTKTLFYNLTGHTSYIRTLAFSPDGKFLVSGSDDKSLRVWNLTSRAEVVSLPQESEGWLISTFFSPNGALLATSEGGVPEGSQPSGKIKLWDVATWRIIFMNYHLESPIIALSPTGTVLVSIDSYVKGNIYASEIKFWNTVRGQVAAKSWDVPSPTTSLVVGSNGTILITADENALINLWNFSTEHVIMEFTGSRDPIVRTSITVSPDEQWLAAGSSDNIIRLWNISSGQNLYNLTGHESSVFSVVFSPDGQWLASGDGEGTIILWNMTNLSQISYHNLTGHISGINALSFSPDGQLLASGSYYANILLWNMTDLSLVTSFLGHTNRITSLAFSPDGLWLASSSWDSKVRYWNLSDSYSLIMPNTAEVNSVALSPDGSILFSGCHDGSINLWNTTSGTLVSVLSSPGQEVLAVAISSDGSTLITAGRDEVVQFWVIDPLPLDLDRDGMLDSWETSSGLDHTDFYDSLSDLDGDGLINSMEFLNQINPQDSDTDGDSLPDLWEFLYGSDPLEKDDGGDTDNDGMLNLYEYRWDLNPLSDDGGEDYDNDGLTNLQEFQNRQLNPFSNDTDNDFMPDGWELQMGLDPKDWRDNTSDFDGDQMPNLWEYQQSFNASDSSDAQSDFDFDGISNLDECKAGTDPWNFWSFPLTQMSILHKILLLIIILSILGITLFLLYRERTRSQLIASLSAPDYKTAVKIHQAGLADYSAYQAA